MAGPNPKLTKHVQKIICDALKVGHPIRAAVAVAGVSEQSFYNWISWGREGKKPYDKFVEAVDRAKGLKTSFLVEQLRAHFPKNWQAIAWYLERTEPKDFGRIDRLAIKSEMKHDVDVHHGIEDHKEIPALLHDNESFENAKKLLRVLTHEEDSGAIYAAGPDELRDKSKLPPS